MSRPVSVEQLQSDIAWAVSNGLGPSDLVPMLRRLIQQAEPGSDSQLMAKTQLAELLVERSPWNAALLARQVLAHRDDDRLWGLLGLAHTLLGNHRSARASYQEALARAPQCASYAHNLGHLLDIAFDAPRQALRWLEQAHRALPEEEEVAASLAHALARCGQGERAEQLLVSALGSTAEAEKVLERWRGRLERKGAANRPTAEGGRKMPETE